MKKTPEGVEIPLSVQWGQSCWECWQEIKDGDEEREEVPRLCWECDNERHEREELEKVNKQQESNQQRKAVDNGKTEAGK